MLSTILTNFYQGSILPIRKNSYSFNLRIYFFFAANQRWKLGTTVKKMFSSKLKSEPTLKPAPTSGQNVRISSAKRYTADMNTPVPIFKFFTEENF